ncbi:hypothetical protein M0R45_007084 [Rubus argutus]|uniref:Uncharacterized protein n=1 Tax=Rubus argutus TaxID=59490 RepID=A0AAW1YSD3_RUBAR
MEDKVEFKGGEEVKKEEFHSEMKTKDAESCDPKEEKTKEREEKHKNVEDEEKMKTEVTSREIAIEENVKESEEEEKLKDVVEEGKEKNKKDKKRKVDKKGKCNDVGKLKQKLEKIDGKIEALTEKKADIMRQIKEAEGTEKPSYAAVAAS